MPVVSRRIVEEERQTRRKLPIDGPFLLILFAIIITGLIALFTASYPDALYDPDIDSPAFYVIRQGGFALAGVGMMFIISKIDYHILHKWQIPVFVLAIFLLAVTPFIGVTRNEATRWIEVGGVSFQTSELMKTAVILSFSSFATIYQKKMRTFRYGVLPYILVLGVIALLLSRQPHLSATIIIGMTGVSILFVAGIKIWYIIPVVAVAVPSMYWYVQHNEYAMTRFRVWLDPFIDYLNKGWQACQSFIAIGSGGLWGLGLGQGRQKHLYLPEPANDFVFSAWCEEMGFIGAVLVMIMFAYLIYRGLYIARNAKDRFGCLLAVGIISKIAIQTLVNLFVVSGIMPVTGAALPFFSYGGTALLLQLMEIGVLLNISRQTKLGRLE